MKLLVGSLILEYLHPLITEDAYLMEQLVVQFLYDIQMNGAKEDELTEAIMDTIEIAYT